MQRSSLGLSAILGLFLAVIGYIVAASMSRREAPTFPPSPIAPQTPADTPIVDTLTVDARDVQRWVYVDFARRSVVLPPDTVGWDLAVRRFHFIAADAIADLGEVPFDSAPRAPDTSFLPNRMRGDTVNPAIQKWYAYSMLTHLLEPNGHVYLVRTREGRLATLEMLSYYCEGLDAGCVTFRYRFPFSPESRLTSPR